MGDVLKELAGWIYGIAMATYMAGFWYFCLSTRRALRKRGIEPLDIRPLTQLLLFVVWLATWPVSARRMLAWIREQPEAA